TSIFILVRLCAWAQPCEPSPEMKTSIEALNSAHGPGEARLAESKKLRDAFPSDYFAHRQYQEQFVRQGLFSKEVQQEYRALMDEHHPNDAFYTVLYARTLKGTNTPELIKLLGPVLERDPENAQAHLKLAEVYSAPAFRDDGKVEEHAKAYWKACPTSLE